MGTELNDKQTRNMIQEKAFWDKDQIEKVRRVFTEGRIKIKERTEKEFKNLYTELENGNTEYIIKKLKNRQFRQFFYNEISKRKFLEEILKAGHPECLRAIIDHDEYYKFDNNYFFTYVTSIILDDNEEGEKGEIRDEQSV